MFYIIVGLLLALVLFLSFCWCCCWSEHITTTIVKEDNKGEALNPREINAPRWFPHHLQHASYLLAPIVAFSLPYRLKVEVRDLLLWCQKGLDWVHMVSLSSLHEAHITCVRIITLCPSRKLIKIFNMFNEGELPVYLWNIHFVMCLSFIWDRQQLWWLSVIF